MPAAEWLLRDWKHDQWIKDTDLVLARDVERRDKKLESLKAEWAREMAPKHPRWFVNGQGLTMVAIAGPVEFMIGSPPTEAGHQDRELLHLKRINRNFAIAAKPVTFEQFARFDNQWRTKKAPARPRHPMTIARCTPPPG